MGVALLPSAAAAGVVHRVTPGTAPPHWRIGAALRRLLRPGSAPWEPPWATIGAALAAAAMAAATLAAAASLAVAAPSAAVAAPPPFAVTPPVAAPPPFAAPPPAVAAGTTDRAPVAVMGLSLAMTPREVLAVLHPQTLALRQRSHPCPTAPAVGCTELIRARTADGWLTIRFADSPPGAAGHARGHALAWRIRLTLSGAGATDPRQVRAADARRAPSIRPDRILWCPGERPGAACPANLPRLRLIGRRDGTRVLSLSNPGLRDRLARASAAAMRRAGVPARSAPAPAG